ncbi:MAG: hypothetical protein IJ675_08225, partial [Pseudobutyrivibrio sp.]|nr:hypothetical protein [Pseudobutyrivibrio sp.]
YMYKTSNDKVTELTEQINTNTKTVYVASREIAAGEKLVADGENANLMLSQIATGLEAVFYLQPTDLANDTYALIDINETVPILYSMTTSTSFDTDTRDYEIQVANLTIDQADYQYIDVRIMWPNGEDQVILAKKQITGLNLEGAVFTTQLNEEEILRMASATIDAFTTSGAYIYTTRYISTEQDAAIPTYLVRAETIDLMNSDPNVLTKATETLNLSARLSLEARLAGLTEEELDAVVSGHGIDDNAGSTTTSSSPSTSISVDDTESDGSDAPTIDEVGDRENEVIQKENAED